MKKILHNFRIKHTRCRKDELRKSSLTVDISLMNLFNSLKTNLLMTDEHNSSSKTTTTKTTTTTTTTTTYITASSPDIAIAINYINCDAAVKLRNSLLGDGQVTKGIEGYTPTKM